jgi:hypothetical protein
MMARLLFTRKGERNGKGKYGILPGTDSRQYGHAIEGFGGKET